MKTRRTKRRKRTKRERSRREEGKKKWSRRILGNNTNTFYVSLYISVFQETTSFLFALRGVSVSSVTLGLRKITIKRAVIPLSLVQGYLRTYLSPQSLPISHLNNIVSLCNAIVNSWKNYEISLINVVCNTYKLCGYYSKTRTKVNPHILCLLKRKA